MVGSISMPPVWSGLRARIFVPLLLIALVPFLVSWVAWVLMDGDFSLGSFGAIIMAGAVAAILAAALASFALTKIARRSALVASEETHLDPPAEVDHSVQPLGPGKSKGLVESFDNALLRDELEEIKTSRQRILRSHQAFRRELAAELHGPIQTRLLVASLQLKRLGKPGASPFNAADAMAVLHEVQGGIDGTREQIREISHRLYPASVQLGLAACLSSLCDRFGDVLSIDLTFERDGGLEEHLASKEGTAALGLSQSAVTVIYQCIEEAVCNVVKHASATSVEILVGRRGPTGLSITVKDDGVGFDPVRAPIRENLGLAMIQDHIHALGGDCAIESRPTEGTALRILVPLHPDGEEVRAPLPEHAFVGPYLAK